MGIFGFIIYSIVSNTQYLPDPRSISQYYMHPGLFSLLRQSRNLADSDRINESELELWRGFWAIISAIPPATLAFMGEGAVQARCIVSVHQMHTLLAQICLQL